jgi:hypothetical protein
MNYETSKDLNFFNGQAIPLLKTAMLANSLPYSQMIQGDPWTPHQRLVAN